MGIQSISHGRLSSPTGPVVQKQTRQPNTANAQPVERKKDTVFLSEKAKDLAAFKAGKSASEETKESPAVKAKEDADGDE